MDVLCMYYEEVSVIQGFSVFASTCITTSWVSVAGGGLRMTCICILCPAIIAVSREAGYSSIAFLNEWLLNTKLTYLWVSDKPEPLFILVSLREDCFCPSEFYNMFGKEVYIFFLTSLSFFLSSFFLPSHVICRKIN